jgi:hypothetical protein
MLQEQIVGHGVDMAYEIPAGNIWLSKNIPIEINLVSNGLY